MFGREEKDTHNDENNGAGNGRIGDVESPPTVKLITENVDVEKINIKEVDNSSHVNTVNNVTNSASGDKGQRP